MAPERHGVIADALSGFHQPSDETGLLPRHHGAFTDSLALTHCACWGGAWKLLDYLLDHPEVFAEQLATERGL